MKMLMRAALCAALVSLAACAGGARPERIAVSSPDIYITGHPLSGTLMLDQVQGGSETNPLWMSNISNEEFREGLEQSLRSAGLMADSPDLAQYRVISNVQSLDRPMAGFDMNVTMSVRYTVAPVGGGAPIFDEVVTTTGVGRMGEEFLGVERLRIAIEAAARENIGEFIRRLGRETDAPQGSMS